VLSLDFPKNLDECLRLDYEVGILALRKTKTNPVFMKKRISRVLNFFAFNLLFFALYLNFIHKDNSSELTGTRNSTASVKGTVLVSDPADYVKKDAKTVRSTAMLQN
jgi:hypothetical protein